MDEKQIQELKEALAKEQESNKELLEKFSTLEKTNTEITASNKAFKDQIDRYIGKVFKFTNDESTIKDNDLSIDEKIALLQEKKGSAL